ncbi:MAG: hypothetical protein JSU01_07810 [Bacteroidetes bacterium]|nr:hypothetical protein [Bacteroidota bacterium]
MMRKSLLYIFIFCLAGTSFANAESFKSDSLQAILKNKSDAVAQKRDLILYLRYAFGDMPEKDLDAARDQSVQLLRSFREDDSEGLIHFIDAICQVRRKHYPEAQNLLLKAVEQANQHDDHYLLYACFTHLAFLRTDEGNVIAAISSFRAAKKEATIVDDAYLQVVIDINLSDIYYRNAMFNQAKFYLNEAQVLLISHHIENQRMENGINYNKAEVYFRTQNIDSLKKYNQLLRQAKKGSFGLYTFQKRTDYYVTLLARNYAQVIQIINALAKDSLYEFKPVDGERLANAYFGAGVLDSAKAVVVGLIKTAGEQSHTERNLRYYKLLGDIEEKKGDYKNASEAYDAALAQTWEQLSRLINVGSVSSQIQIDQVQNSYALRTETFKRERLWLIFIITAITLFIIIVALLYYNVRRKKYYEKLLFESEKNEIAFINSHEVRRHASNIMGIVQVIHQAENKYENFIESEEHLINELNSLDKAIRDISNKLSG